jgi:hypothetical protein
LHADEFRGATTLCEESPYYSVNAGEAFEVQFLPSDPAVNRLRGGTQNDAPPVAFFLLMPVFILVIFSPMIVPQFREVLRARRQFKKGRLTVATVVFVKKRLTASWPGWAGNNASEVFVKLKPPAGEQREAVAWCPNDWLVNHLAPGEKVRVV